MANIVQFSIDDTSPTISYFPFRDTLSTPNLSAGWNPYFLNSGFASAPGVKGNGTSYHITSLNGAAISITWRGTSIQLQGNVTDATYTVELDGIPLTNPEADLAQNVLATVLGLNNTYHTISLSAQIPEGQQPSNSSMVVFDQAIIASTPPVVNSSSPDNFYKQSFLNDNDIAFLGKWNFVDDGNSSSHRSDTAGDRATASFRGTSFILKGTTSPESGNYSVTLNNETATFSARSSFLAHESLLYYYTGLDPNLTYTVTVTNEGGGTLGLLAGGFGVYAIGSPNTPSSVPPSSAPLPVSAASFPRGTIAAFVLAGILACLVFSGLLYYIFICRPRRRFERERARWRRSQVLQRHSKAEEAGTVIDIGRRRPSGDRNIRDIALELGMGQPEIRQSTRRDSGKSGFARWKREVENAVGGDSLGIQFRHSGVDDDKEYAHDGTMETESDPVSTQSSFSIFRPSLMIKNGRGGSKEGTKGKSKNRSKGKEGNRRPSEEEMLPAQASAMGSPSYMAAPAAHQADLSYSVAPPSYAASISNGESTPLSVPRSVTHSSSHPTVTLSPTKTRTKRRRGSEDKLRRHPAASPQTSQTLSLTPPFPIRDLSKEDRGSLLDQSIDEDPRLLSGAAVREVIRSLSPRTSRANFPRRSQRMKSTNTGVHLDVPPPPSHRAPRPLPQVPLPEMQQSPLPPPQRQQQLSPVRSPTNPEQPKPAAAENNDESKTDEPTGAPHARPSRVGFEETTWLAPPSIRSSAPPSSRKTGSTYANLPPSSTRYSRRMSRLLQPEFVEGTSRRPFRLTPASFQPPIRPPRSLQSGNGEGGEGTRDSFIDFTASSDVSTNSRSNGQTDASSVGDVRRYSTPPQYQEGLGLPEERSRWSSSNSAPISTQDLPTNEDRKGDDDSGGNGNGDESTGSDPVSAPSSTFPIPFKISIPPGMELLPPEPRSRFSTSDTSTHSDPVHVHPPIENLESPTESIPFSLSDVGFFHGSDSEELQFSQLPRARGDRTSMPSPLSSRPPLPPPDSSYDSEMTPTPPPAGLSPPNYIVQRVLGLHSPTSTVTARPGHSRSGSNLALHGTSLASRHDASVSSQRQRQFPDTEPSRTMDP